MGLHLPLQFQEMSTRITNLLNQITCFHFSKANQKEHPTPTTLT